LALSELCPNLKSLQVDDWISGEWISADWISPDWDDSNNTRLAKIWKKLEVIQESCSEYVLTVKLLNSSLIMMYLTNITVYLYNQPVAKFFNN
jgi:hypothetical protein